MPTLALTQFDQPVRRTFSPGSPTLTLDTTAGIVDAYFPQVDTALKVGYTGGITGTMYPGDHLSVAAGLSVTFSPVLALGSAAGTLLNVTSMTFTMVTRALTAANTIELSASRPKWSFDVEPGTTSPTLSTAYGAITVRNPNLGDKTMTATYAGSVSGTIAFGQSVSIASGKSVTFTVAGTANTAMPLLAEWVGP